jgi:hypothetical protein
MLSRCFRPEVHLRTRPAESEPGSVRNDWRTPLSQEKSIAYDQIVGRLETAYAMFSVSLDEALGMRRKKPAVAARLLTVSPALCERLSGMLVAHLRAMLDHARHFGVTPNLALLDPTNFQSVKSQRVARFNSLFGKILLTRKSQFVTKIDILAELTEELSTGFQEAANRLIEENTGEGERNWELLDAVHYDLNTCLRETVVVLKSFLHALPERQLSQFRERVREQMSQTKPARAVRDVHLAHRRMTPLKGQ